MATYCTRADLEQRVGADGVALRLDDDGALVADVIEDASADIDYYLALAYDTAYLADNAWVKNAAKTIAVRYLCQRRLNAAPASVESRWKELSDRLEQIRLGRANVPGLARRKAAVPVLSQPRVNLWPFPTVVTERQHSTGKPEGYTKADDPREPPPNPY